MSNLRDLINREDDYSYNYTEDPANAVDTEGTIKTRASSNTDSPDSLAQNIDVTSETFFNEKVVPSFQRIKARFPAARIKKIMQSDEEIGKVAQATPVIVGRALEIFMANLIEVAIIEAKSQGCRRIAASHIRSAVENTEQFDFLMDTVSKYPASKTA